MQNTAEAALAKFRNALKICFELNVPVDLIWRIYIKVIWDVSFDSRPGADSQQLCVPSVILSSQNPSSPFDIDYLLSQLLAKPLPEFPSRTTTSISQTFESASANKTAAQNRSVG